MTPDSAWLCSLSDASPDDGSEAAFKRYRACHAASFSRRLIGRCMADAARAFCRQARVRRRRQSAVCVRRLARAPETWSQPRHEPAPSDRANLAHEHCDHAREQQHALEHRDHAPEQQP